ncbi:MAG: putative lipid II flippase FtsW, partial [Chloroflexota bacterium]
MAGETRQSGAARQRAATGRARMVDYPLVLTIIALLAFGLIMVYSASVVTAYTTYHNQFYFLTRQAVSACIGLAAMLVLMRLDYHLLRVISLPGLVGSIILLALVLLPGVGTEVYGAQRWIRLPGFQVQPSEFAKVAFIIYMSHWFTAKREQVRDLAYGFLPFAVLLAVIMALLLKQPDMGTAFVVLATSLAIFFAAGAHPVQLAFFVAVTALSLVPLIRMAPYRMARVLAFLDPWERPLGNGYHVIQALLAFGAGGLTGVGLGVGRQKFLYLPFPHTDSIFAVIGEELGLAGTLGLLALFLFFAYRGLRIAWYAADQFGRLLATGVTCGITVQAFTNMGVLTSSVPFTGITLPFISAGGSSLIATLAGCGILLNVSRQTRSPDDQPQPTPR